MTKRLRFGFLLFILTVLLIFAGLVLHDYFYKEFNHAIDEFYSPDNYIADSIADARQRQIFVSQLELQNPVIRGLGSKYEIREMWIDKIVRIKYEGVYPNKRMQLIPLQGYRLMIRFNQSVNTEHNITCNNSIKINGWQSDKVRFAEIQAPITSSVYCTIEEEG
jgi:hypothetical protein